MTVVCIFFNFNLNKESCCLSQRSSLDKIILLNINFGTPRRWHIQSLGQILQLLFFVRNFIQPIVFQFMDLFISSVSKQFIMKHNILPSNCFIKLELNLINFMFRLHMNKEVSMVKNSVNEQVRRIFSVINFSCWRLNEFILKDTSFSLFK